MKFTKGNIIYSKKQKSFFEVMNNPYFEGGVLEGIYSLRDIRSDKTYYVNSDMVEKTCTLCRNDKNIKVLYGTNKDR